MGIPPPGASRRARYCLTPPPLLPRPGPLLLAHPLPPFRGLVQPPAAPVRVAGLQPVQQPVQGRLEPADAGPQVVAVVQEDVPPQAAVPGGDPGRVEEP